MIPDYAPRESLVDPWRTSGRHLPCAMSIHCDSCTFFSSYGYPDSFIYVQISCPFCFFFFFFVTSRILLMIAFWSWGMFCLSVDESTDGIYVQATN